MIKKIIVLIMSVTLAGLVACSNEPSSSDIETAIAKTQSINSTIESGIQLTMTSLASMATETQTPTPSETAVPTLTPTYTVTPSVTLTPSVTPTITNTPLPEGFAIAPDVIGMNFTDAKEKFREAGFIDISKNIKESEAIPGTIFQQEPAPGDMVLAETKVKLFVAVIKEPIFSKYSSTGTETVYFSVNLDAGKSYEVNIWGAPGVSGRVNCFMTSYYATFGDNFYRIISPQVSGGCHFSLWSTSGDPALATSPPLSQYEVRIYRIIQSP